METSVRDRKATLSIDARPWQQGLRHAQQQLQQFGQSISRIVTPGTQAAQQQMNGLAHSVGQVTTQMTQAARATSTWAQVLQVAAGIGLATSIQGIVQSLATFVSTSI